MAIHDQILPKEAFEFREPTSSLQLDQIRRLQIVMWVETCADYYAAAAMYEQLSGLSDAELMHRGLSRGTLAHDICAACEGRAGP